jgi:cell shape-determining protein MreD
VPIVLYLLFVGMLAVLAQMILPFCFPIVDLLGLGSALVPFVVIYASLELGDYRAPILAVILGLMLDLLNGSHRVGTSVMVLFSLSALIVPQAEREEAHTWIMRCTFVLVGTFLFYVMTYLLILVENARWVWPFNVWSKIAFGTLFNLILTPVYWMMISLPARLFGWRPAYEKQERSYAG